MGSGISEVLRRVRQGDRKTQTPKESEVSCQERCEQKYLRKGKGISQGIIGKKERMERTLGTLGQERQAQSDHDCKPGRQGVKVRNEDTTTWFGHWVANGISGSLSTIFGYSVERSRKKSFRVRTVAMAA